MKRPPPSGSLDTLLPRPDRLPITDNMRVQMERCVRYGSGGTAVILEGEQLAALPTWLRAVDWTLVTEVSVGMNGLREWPRELARFRRVERLGIGSNGIGAIPDEIGELRQLVWLDFTHNRISHISDRIGDLPRLASLGASDCRLTSFPLSFTRLRRLRKLGMFNNLITSLPPEIGHLTTLTKLDLSGNTLTSIPPEIGMLTNLSWLNVSNNHLTSLPTEMGNLLAMRELGLAHNKLKTLPDMSRLRQLELLTAFNNEIEELGPWICRLPRLAKIDLSANKLRSLPAAILALPSLELLNIRQNELAELPSPNAHDPLHRPTSLEIIDVRDNKLVSLPISVLCASLKDMKCTANPFYVGSLPQNVAVPYLKHLAAHYLANEVAHQRASLLARLPPILKKLAMEVWEGRQGMRCTHCRAVYLHAPVRMLDFRQATDEEIVPFVVTLCSSTCRSDYARSSVASTISQLSYQADMTM